MEALLAAIISGGLALIGTIITVNASAKKTEQTLRTELAVMKTEVTTLRKEVEKHNNFAVKIPALTTKVDMLKADCDQKFERLEGFHIHA